MQSIIDSSHHALQPSSKVTHAAVGVIQRADGFVLLGERPVGKPWAGYWEFPGGKIEAYETPEQALKRELHEELGISVSVTTPWLTREYAYPEKTVKLHFFRVRHWQGEPHGREGQRLSWQNTAQVNVSPLLPANQTMMQALNLPALYAITNAAELGELGFLSKLEHALQHGLKLIQIREKAMLPDELIRFSQEVIRLAHDYGAKVLLNGDVERAKQLGADGVHFPSHLLCNLDEKPAGLLCAASCHNTAELVQAAKLDLDFVVLSPVKATKSHLEAIPLGWEVFGQRIQNYPLPVYALGGMAKQDLQTAWQYGAHGLAMQRGAW